MGREGEIPFAALLLFGVPQPRALPLVERSMTDPRDPRPPAASLLLGYGAMLPLILAAIGAWVMPRAWPVAAVHLAVIWAALILAFVGGVRRGFGFATPGAGTAAEATAGIVYFTLGGLALLLMPYAWLALWPLVVGFVLVALLDRQAARRGLAPAHFAALRLPQMLIGAAALALMWVRVMI